MECRDCYNTSTSAPDHALSDIFTRFAARRQFERSLGHIVGPAFIAMNSLSLLANVAILAVLIRRGLRTRTAVIIINLGVNDIVLLCVGTPWTVTTYVSDSWPLGSVSCKIVIYGLKVALHVEVYTIMLLACLRYLAITKPLSSFASLTNMKVYLLLSAVWISALCLNTPAAKFATLVPFAYDNNTEILCIRMAIRSSSPAERTYGKCHFVLTYTIPVIITLALLAASIHKLNHSNMCIAGQLGYTRKRKQAVLRLIALTLTYAICVLPIHMLSLVRFALSSRVRHSREYIIVEICALFFAFMRCFLHPMLYNCMATDFRQEAVKMITRQNSLSSDFTRKCNSEVNSRYGVILYMSSPRLVNGR